MAEVFNLEAKLDLSAAAALREQLLPFCDGDLAIDAKDVTHMGALCAQVLISASSKARSGGHTFGLINTSDRVLGQMGAMGLSPECITRGDQ